MGSSGDATEVVDVILDAATPGSCPFLCLDVVTIWTRHVVVQNMDKVYRLYFLT